MLLFFARALDLSLLTAVCQLSFRQSAPTQHDLAAAHRLLAYASSHPNPQKTIHPSSMALWACTDASFLPRPKSGSVAGCSVGLGDPPSYLTHSPSSRRQRICLPRHCTAMYSSSTICTTVLLLFVHTYTAVHAGVGKLETNRPFCMHPALPIYVPSTSITHNSQRPSSRLLPTHNRGGCVCGRGWIRRRLWRRSSLV